MATRPKRPRDPFQLAKLIGDISTGEAKDQNPNEGKNPAAVELGRRGGLKGKGRWDSLSPEQRKELGRSLVYARWRKAKSGNKP
jgi:hypothetical protein